MIDIETGKIVFDNGSYLYPFMGIGDLIYKGFLTGRKKIKKSNNAKEQYLFNENLCDLVIHIKNDELYKVYIIFGKDIPVEESVFKEYLWGTVYKHEEEPNKLIIRFINK